MNAKLKETILNPIFKGNPITVLVLGICSSLAVTVTMKGAHDGHPGRPNPQIL